MTFFYMFRVFIALVFVACCLQLGKTKNCEITREIKKATTFVMRKCNSNIEDYYEQNSGEDVQTTYCEGMRVTNSIVSLSALLPNTYRIMSLLNDTITIAEIMLGKQQNLSTVSETLV